MDLKQLKRECPAGTEINWNDGASSGTTTCEVWEVAPGEPVVMAGTFRSVVDMRSWPNNRGLTPEPRNGDE